MTMFKKATRKASRLRVGLESPSGGGKTYTALVIASVLAAHDGGRVAVIDSERGSAGKYAEGRPFDFDTAILDRKDPIDYIEALLAAEKAGFPVAVIDSASHEWKGVLGMVDRAAAGMQGNTWAGWSKGRPAHDAFVETIVSLKAHVIATFRSKQETRQVKRDGKTVVEKLGNAPVTDDAMDFEFDVWGSIDHETHTVLITKSRIDTIPVGSEWVRGEGIAEAYLAWIEGAEYAEPEHEASEVLKTPAAAGDSGPARGPRQNGVAAPPAHLETPAHLYQWAKFHHNMSPGEVAAALGVSDPQGVRPTIAGEKFNGDVDAAAKAIVVFLEGVEAAKALTALEAPPAEDAPAADPPPAPAIEG